MSSVSSRGFAQVAPKKNFVVDVDYNGYGDMFLQSDFDAWYAANSAAIMKLGNMYVVKDSSNFINTINGSNPLGHALGSNYLSQFNKHTLVDMGKEISIGIQTNSHMLVFRQVAIPFNSSLDGSHQIGYIVTENNAANLTRPRFQIAAARA